MKPRFSDYPIGQLLLTIIAHSGLQPMEFFAELGYRNFSKAIGILDVWLSRGEGDPRLFSRLQASRFAVEEGRLAEVKAENEIKVNERRVKEAQEVEQYQRERFHPYIEAIPELSVPTQISMYCVTGGNERFNTQLPDDISEWSWEDQQAFLKKVVPENFAAHNGLTFFRGKITGYFFHPSFDAERIRLTIDGDIDTSGSPHVEIGLAALSFQNGKSTFLFR